MVVFVGIGVYAQDDEEFKTIFNGEIQKVRGFGGPNMAFSVLSGEFAHLMGGGGGIILNDQLLLGGWGLGVTNDIPAKPYLDDNGDNYYKGLELDYDIGGLWFGYIIKGKYPVHPVIHAQIGWGSAELTNRDGSKSGFNPDGIFVINPIVELEMNITQFFRLGVGANYRLNFGANNLTQYSNSDFSGPGGFLSFKFGWF